MSSSSPAAYGVKKFINSVQNVVPDAIRGLIVADGNLKYCPHNFRVVVRRDVDQLGGKQRVTLLAGGGSGHEPFAAGFVGTNGLSAAVCGDVFASPSCEAVYDGIREVTTGPGGTIVYVINYTGDRLNFGMAVERFKAETKRDNVDLVYIDDDVSLEDKTGLTVGGRGIAGASLLLWIVGVLAEHNAVPFAELLSTSRRIVANTATFGVSLEPCAIPGKGRMFALPPDEMELGLGIHGEPGCQRTKIQTAGEIVNTVLTRLTESKRLQLKTSDRFVALINNLGSTSPIEISVVLGEVVQWFARKGYTHLFKVYIGTVMTSIDGHGLSLTILRLEDESWGKALNTSSAVSRHLTSYEPPLTELGAKLAITEASSRHVPVQGAQIPADTAARFKKALLAAATKLESSEAQLNALDGCGDGDCGSTLKTAALSIKAGVREEEIDFTHPQTALLQLAYIFEKSVGGTTGAIYALFLTAGSVLFESAATGPLLHDAGLRGLEAVMKYGHAKPGHRTMVDPVHAALEAVAAPVTKQDWEKAVVAAEQKAADTAKMLARSGRASYTTADQQTQPDPGALAVSYWMRAAFDAFYEGH